MDIELLPDPPIKKKKHVPKTPTREHTIFIHKTRGGLGIVGRLNTKRKYRRR
jgi:hypothetical protein